ncbi:MAG: J domain-containing protein [Patescibacteria group bacterium]|nr:J domain-containing protein [Patescibacteria group bacterium]
MSEQQAYPLSWPEGWPRTAPGQRMQSRFMRRRSMEEACHFLSGELERLLARKCVLSTNVERRLDGTPYSNRAQPQDKGAGVYFELKGRPTVLACDRWLRVEDNVYAIAKHIEAIRAQDRWGVGSVEQAFRGYTALPGIGQSEASTWWATLGVAVNASDDQVREAYRILVKKHHPDRGGDPELFHRVQKAMERFEAGQRSKEAA